MYLLQASARDLVPVQYSSANPLQQYAVDLQRPQYRSLLPGAEKAGHCEHYVVLEDKPC
jgi:hypothetical protein